jgi:lysozyme
MAWEGFAPVGYHDRIDPKGVNTIGYGHIENVTIGQRITKVQAGVLLAKDLPKYEKQVERCIKVPMPGYRHAAIVSFTYNVGGGALCKGSVARYINAGDWEKGCDALLLYDKANGRVITGLENRRKAERKLCYNVNEPPLPSSEVMALRHENVDQQVADAEAAAEAKRLAKPIIVKPAAPAPAAPDAHYVPHTGSAVYNWLMEK